MPISGLVVTLSAPGPDAEQAIAWLRGDARFALGEPEPTAPRRMPVTLDTADRAEDKHLWGLMQDHAGIAFVDVACVFFEDDAPGSTPAIASEPNQPEATHTLAQETPHARSRPW